MRIAVLGGGGAMGGLFGGYLAEAGHDVTLIDVSRPAIERINADGLLIDEKDGSQRRIRVRASDDPSSVGPAELIVNFVKCYHTDAAIRSAAPMITDETTVLSLQNGWGNAPVIASIVGEDRVMIGLTYHGGMLMEPGHVRHPGAGMTYLGELGEVRDGRVARIAEVLNGAGLEATPSGSILDEVWKKLALNVCTLPTSALLRFHSDELVAFEGTKTLMASLLREVAQVAAAQGIALDYDERWNAITSLLEKAVGGKSSMFQDMAAGRRTEIDVINGAIVAAGRQLGIPTPANDVMVSMVEAAEARALGQAR